MKGFRAVAWAAVTVLLVAAEPRPSMERSASSVGSSSFAILHASVIPMDSERILRDHTILVQGDRIAALAPDGAVALPSGTLAIDAGGAYVLPGLIDSHVHIRRRELGA